MTQKENLYKVLSSFHVSEKSSNLIEKNNAFTLRVDIKSNKTDIKRSIEKFFQVFVEDVRTVIVKGKRKRFGKFFGNRKKWKKAYIKIKKGQNLNFLRKK
ncbi:50S ribosomal protein L23 [Candidatus Riesia pediculicola]|uniref:50S ribosomal protein L23 n=1 Tax=Candidatus Riesia pediculicola TaxID=401619 RepID=UPI0009C3AD81|nr:50S ribosomal protein L23 [Candidatus Riesia pediculicola]ARC54346.1 50S ribosomal protein L23 [Candidatus Riesia pediculicola]